MKLSCAEVAIILLGSKKKKQPPQITRDSEPLDVLSSIYYLI